MNGEIDKANRIITREKAEFEHLMYIRLFLNWEHKGGVLSDSFLLHQINRICFIYHS